MTPEGLKNIETIPNWLDTLAESLDRNKITSPSFRCNHYLINCYPTGSGIMPHTDGPLYHPYVCIISLGSPILFKFYENNQKHSEDNFLHSLLIEPGSLLVFEQDLYTEYLHSILDQEQEGIKIKYRLEKDDEGNFNLERENVTIDNFILTKLYKIGIKSLEQCSYCDYQSLEMSLREVESKFENYSFVWKFYENFCYLDLFVKWNRSERTSLTIRYVKPGN